MEAGRLALRGHSWLHGEFASSLGYMKPCLKRNRHNLKYALVALQNGIFRLLDACVFLSVLFIRKVIIVFLEWSVICKNIIFHLFWWVFSEVRIRSIKFLSVEKKVAKQVDHWQIKLKGWCLRLFSYIRRSHL